MANTVNNNTAIWLNTAENMFNKWSSNNEDTERSAHTQAIARHLNALEREAEQNAEHALTFSQALRLTHQLDDSTTLRAEDFHE
jgi:hypothetical protein